MPIRVRCRQCQKTLSVNEKYAGRRFKCPGCSASVSVPSPAITATPPPTAPASDADLFGFTGAPAPGGGGGFDFDSAPSAAESNGIPSEDRYGWHSTAAGLTLVWYGTCAQLLAVSVVFLAGVAVTILGTSAVHAVETAGGEPVRAGSSTDAAAAIGGVGVFLAVGAFLFLGTVLRLIGYARCLAVPAGGGATVIAIFLLVCEIALIGGQGLVFVGPFLHFAVAFLGQLIASGASLLGLLFLLIFVVLVGSAINSKRLSGQVINFVIWIVIAVLLSVGGSIGFSIYTTAVMREPPTQETFNRVRLALVGLAVLMLMLWLTVMVKYLGLYSGTSDEIRRRVGRYRPE